MGPAETWALIGGGVGAAVGLISTVFDNASGLEPRVSPVGPTLLCTVFGAVFAFGASQVGLQTSLVGQGRMEDMNHVVAVAAPAVRSRPGAAPV